MNGRLEERDRHGIAFQAGGARWGYAGSGHELRPCALGAFGANQHLRQSLMAVIVPAAQ
jgi:hypothetical protein